MSEYVAGYTPDASQPGAATLVDAAPLPQPIVVEPASLLVDGGLLSDVTTTYETDAAEDPYSVSQPAHKNQRGGPTGTTILAWTGAAVVTGLTGVALDACAPVKPTNTTDNCNVPSLTPTNTGESSSQPITADLANESGSARRLVICAPDGSNATPSATETPTSQEQQEYNQAMQVASDWLSGKSDDYIQLLETTLHEKGYTSQFGTMVDAHDILMSPVYAFKGPAGTSDARVLFLTQRTTNGKIERGATVLTVADPNVLQAKPLGINQRTGLSGGVVTDGEGQSYTDSVSIIAALNSKINVNQKLAVVWIDNKSISNDAPFPKIVIDQYNNHEEAAASLSDWAEGKIATSPSVATNLDQLKQMMNTPYAQIYSLPYTNDITFV